MDRLPTGQNKTGGNDPQDSKRHKSMGKHAGKVATERIHPESQMKPLPRIPKGCGAKGIHLNR